MRGSRQVSAPDAPLNQPHLSLETHSPSFYGEGKAGALDPDGGKRPSAGAGAGPALVPFLAQQLWALPSAAAGARERRAGGGSSASAAASTPPRPVPQDCSWHWRVGKLEGGARGEPCRLCLEPGAGL